MTKEAEEYTGDVFAEACEALGVVQSMGRVGDALDCEDRVVGNLSYLGDFRLWLSRVA